MPVEIIECQQGSPEWFAARLGIPTASMFKTVMASGRGGGESATRKDYMLKLADEIIFGEPMETYSNGHMERGKEMEAEARKAYALITDADPQQVGFVRNGNKGCSPDSLVGTAGMLEVKTALPHILTELVLKDEFPPAHKAQCQGGLWVAERDHNDLCVFWTRRPPFIKRVYRDEAYIRQLADAVEIFNAELAEMVETLKRRGHAKAA